MLRVIAGLMLIIGSFGCGEKPCDNCGTGGGSGGAGTGGGSATGGGSTGGAGGGSAGGSAGGAAGGTAWMPFPTRAACDAPTVQQGASITDGGTQLLRPRLIWAGTEAGLIYQENGGGDRRVFFQRLTGAGQLKGTRSLLATDAGQFGASTAGASDGTRYLLCVEGAGCSTAPVGSGDATSVAFSPSATAGGVSLAVGPGGFVFAQGNSVQALTPAGAASGTVKTFGAAPPAGKQTRLVARTSGYAVAIGQQLYRLDATLQQAGTSVTIASASVGQIELASSGDLVGAIFSLSSHATAEVIDTATGSVSTPVNLQPNDTTYGQVSIAGGTASFATAWSAFNGFIGYRPLSSAGVAGGDAGFAAINVGWDDNMNAIVAVDDGFLVASNISPSATALQVVHLTCP